MYPSLSCLFRRAPRAGAGAGAGAAAAAAAEVENDVDPQQQRQEQERLPVRHRSITVNREDVVVALLRLRGDSGTAGAAAHRKRGRGQLLPAHGADVRRRRVLLRAVRKVARCCQVAGVRTAPTLAATLACFDFGPADESRQKAGCMRTVDLWHWLRLLSAPIDPVGGEVGSGMRASFSDHRSIHDGQRRTKGAIGHHRNTNNRRESFGTRGGVRHRAGDGMVSGRLLDSEETSLLLDTVECRSVVGEAGEVTTSVMVAAAAGSGFYVSVTAFWDLLLEHSPGLWDRELEARLEAAEVR